MAAAKSREIRAGIIGFDTSHVTAFTRLLNDPADPDRVPGARIVAGWPTYSRDIRSSHSRVGDYRREMAEKWGIKIVSSAAELLELVDAVFIESLDGRRHLPEFRQVVEAGKPVFIDKPLAASYREAKKILALAARHSCPVFSSSSLRFDSNIVEARRDPELKVVCGCDASSPSPLEKTNPGLFWYGIHGVEMLYTFMGGGCRSVSCVSTRGTDLVAGRWKDGRVGTIRGMRKGGWGYGVTVFGEKKIARLPFAGKPPIYAQLLREIVPFFRTGKPPVAPAETLEIMRFIEAADRAGKEKREVALSEIR